MLTIKNLSVSIKQASILRDINLHIPVAGTVGLVGRNGAGKTTLMRSIMGLIAIEKGEIDLQNQSLIRSQAYTRAWQEVGYLPEDRRLIPTFTVEENLMVPLWAINNKNAQERIKWVYKLMPEIARFHDRKALSLSGGQQKLVALGRALVYGTKLLLLDEPFEGIAPALARRLMEVIAGLKKEGISVLLSESDYTHSADLVEKVYLIERGHVDEMNPNTKG